MFQKIRNHWRALWGTPKRTRPDGWKRPTEWVKLLGGPADDATIKLEHPVQLLEIPFRPTGMSTSYVPPSRPAEIRTSTYRRGAIEIVGGQRCRVYWWQPPTR